MEIIKLEINEIEKRKQIESIKLIHGSWRAIKLRDLQPLWQKKKIEISNIKNEKEVITIYPRDI